MVTDSSVIQPGTLALLKRLMADAELSAFTLVGGTALALQLGHRLSIDLDLFCKEEFNSTRLEEYMRGRYGFKQRDLFNNGLMGFVDGVKIDFIRHGYRDVSSTVVEEDVRMASTLDISAMKLNAISGNGTRQKDFYDMYILLEHHPLRGMLVAYEQKYPHSGAPIALKSLTYFDDVDHEREPALMVQPIPFAAVRERLRAAVIDPERVFGEGL